METTGRASKVIRASFNLPVGDALNIFEGERWTTAR